MKNDETRKIDGFFRQVRQPWQLIELLDCIPDVYYFIKNRDCQFVKVSQSLAQLHGFSDAEQMAGLCDHDVSPAVLADQYVAEDVSVMLLVIISVSRESASLY
jgi:hypothetical protein